MKLFTSKAGLEKQFLKSLEPCQQVELSGKFPLIGVTLHRPLSIRAVEINVWSVYQSSLKLAKNMRPTLHMQAKMAVN